MELDTIKLRTTWNDAAGSINSNYVKIADAIAQLKANGGGGGISELTSKMIVDALGYTPYNANNPANYITSAALAPYALKTDIPSLAGYATEVFVNNKLNAYTTTEDLAENYASKNDLETAINNIDLSLYLKTEDAKETYATKDYVTTKLVDYAPLTSVQGFENRIRGLEGVVPQLNERVETVESKVATLNEYVVTGDNNLLNRVNVIEQEYATKTYVDSVEQLAATKLDSSYFTLTNIKSTLGISDWALASAKPTYTASEVGALGVNGTAQSSLKMTPEYLTDLNNATPWRFFDMRSGYGSTDGNKPSTAWASGITGTVAGSSVYRWQLAYASDSPRPYFRKETAGAWSDWLTLALTSDIPTKLSQLTDDVVAGKYLPLSGGTINSTAVQPLYLKNNQSSCGILFFNNTDNATLMYSGGSNWRVTDNGWSNAYSLLHSGNIGNYKSGDSAHLNGIGTGWWNGIPHVQPDGVMNIGKYIDFHDSSTSPNDFDVRLQCISTNQNSVYLPSATGQLALTTDNVASATKLATRHKLWGNDFDGTADVSGNLVGSNFTIRNRATNPYLSLTDAYGKVYFQIVNGNAYMGSTDSKSLIVDGSGNVGIGTTSPTEKLDVSGNIKASGNINATSITINGVTITASNGTITVNGNVFAKGDIVGGV